MSINAPNNESSSYRSFNPIPSDMEEYDYGDMYSTNRNNAVGKQEENTIIETKPKEPTNVLLSMKKAGIVLTAALPLSSRGIPAVLIRSSITLIKSTMLGLSQKINGQPVIAFQEMKENLKTIWNGSGIISSYKNIAKMSKEEAYKIAEDGFAYSKELYVGNLNKLPSELKESMENFKNQMKELGFQTDKNGIFFDPKTGNLFNLAFSPSKKEVLVFFGGLGSSDILKFTNQQIREGLTPEDVNISAVGGAIGDFIGKVQPSALQAIEVGKALKNALKDSLDYTPTIVGHSHGGGLAQVAALANDMKGVIFNSRPMGAGIRRFIGQDKIAENSKNITAFSIKGDSLTGNKCINVLSIAFERLTGIPVAGTAAAQAYELPAGPNGKPHVLFSEALETMVKNTKSN